MTQPTELERVQASRDRAWKSSRKLRRALMDIAIMIPAHPAGELAIRVLKGGKNADKKGTGS